MEQITTPQPAISLAARITTYFMAVINILVSGYFLFDILTSNRFPGAGHIRFMFGLWFSLVLTFSIYSFIKPSWVKFITLSVVILLEAGFIFYSLMGAIY